MEIYTEAIGLDLIDLIHDLEPERLEVLRKYLALDLDAQSTDRPEILISPEVCVDVEAWDFCREADRWEINEMIEYLEDNGHINNQNLPSTPKEIFESGCRPLEQEFGLVLNKLWESRDFLSADQKARIEAITKESYI